MADADDLAEELDGGDGLDIDADMDFDEVMHAADAKVNRLTQTFQFVLTYRELFRGTGLEFAQLKEYVPGEDDASRIDWRASMRSEKIYVKEYEEERDLDVIVLLDASSSMLFGTQNMLKHRFAGILAGAVVKTALQIGDNVAFGMFADGMKHFFEPTNADTQYYRALEYITDSSNYGGRPNFDETLKFILNNIDENSYLFIISDFIGMEEDWANSLKMVSAKLNDVVGIMVRDRRDEELPEGSGRFRLRDPYSDNTIVVNLDKVKEEFEDRAQRQSEEVQQGFRRADTGFVKVFTDEPFIKDLIREMNLRSR